VAFPQRVLCDACTPDQASVRTCAAVYAVFMIGLLAITIGVLVYLIWIIPQSLNPH
jgi:hypothetical protein